MKSKCNSSSWYCFRIRNLITSSNTTFFQSLHLSSLPIDFFVSRITKNCKKPNRYLHNSCTALMLGTGEDDVLFLWFFFAMIKVITNKSWDKKIGSYLANSCFIVRGSSEKSVNQLETLDAKFFYVHLKVTALFIMFAHLKLHTK